MESPVKPTLGRNIRYVLTQGIRRGEARAAIITAVWTGIPTYVDSQINLTVFADLANDEGAEKFATSAPYDPTGKEPGTWHWPADAGDGFERQSMPKATTVATFGEDSPEAPLINDPNQFRLNIESTPPNDEPLFPSHTTVEAPAPETERGFTETPVPPDDLPRESPSPEALAGDSTGDTPPADDASGSSADTSSPTTGGDSD